MEGFSGDYADYQRRLRARQQVKVGTKKECTYARMKRHYRNFRKDNSDLVEKHFPSLDVDAPMEGTSGFRPIIWATMRKDWIVYNTLVAAGAITEGVLVNLIYNKQYRFALRLIHEKREVRDAISLQRYYGDAASLRMLFKRIAGGNKLASLLETDSTGAVVLHKCSLIWKLVYYLCEYGLRRANTEDVMRIIRCAHQYKLPEAARIVCVLKRIFDVMEIGEWRPRLHLQFPQPFRMAMRTLVVLAKARPTDRQEADAEGILTSRYPQACLCMLPEELLQYLYAYIGAGHVSPLWIDCRPSMYGGRDEAY